jgi:predicted ATPase
VTLPAAGQGLVAGDLVNTAARIQHIAGAGELLVDGTTARAAGQFSFEPAGERRLRGRRQPVHVYRASLDAAPRRRGARHRGPFVGRDPELELLVQAVSRVASGARPSYVLVTGIAGIGKSRLVWELQRRVHSAAPEFRWLAAKTSSYQDAATYAPLADIVARLLRLRDPSDTRVRRVVRSAVKRLSSDQWERVWLTSALETLLLPAESVAGDQLELFTAWRRFLELATVETPCVLVIEDLQWARPEMVDFVDWLVSAPAGRYALFLVARPEIAGLGSVMTATLESLHLPALTDPTMDLLIGALAPTLTPEQKAAVRRRADGVPLYAVELARMFQDRADAAPPVEGTPADLPPTLHALISARIDELPASPRATLLAAAVLGQAFALDALDAVAGAESRVAGDLPVLVEREFIAADGPRHSFVQGLVREVAYRTLGRRERRTLDIAAADHYQAQGAATVASVAEHLWSAHQATRGEADSLALADRSRLALGEAGESALRVAAPRTALDFFERALTIAAPMIKVAPLHERAGTAARLAANLMLAESHFRRAIALREDSGDGLARARATAELAGVLLLEQHNTAARKELERAWRAARNSIDVGMAELAGQLARVHAISGNDEAAIEWADRALTMIELAPRPAMATSIEAHVTRGTARAGAGDERGLDELREAAALAAERGMPAAELRAINNLSWLLVADDPRASVESAGRGVELARRFGAQEMELQLTNVAATAAIDTGDWQRSRERYDEILGRDVDIAYRIDAAVGRTVIAVLAGEPAPAAYLERLGHLPRTVDHQQRAIVDYARALIAFVDGDFASASVVAGQAAKSLLGMDEFNAFALAGRAALWSRDVDSAKWKSRTLEELPVHGRAADTMRTTLRAGVTALTGKSAFAKAAYAGAEAEWRALHLDVQLVLARLERVQLIGGRRVSVPAHMAGLRQLAERTALVST